jgi:hypothetical protein
VVGGVGFEPTAPGAVTRSLPFYRWIPNSALLSPLRRGDDMPDWKREQMELTNGETTRLHTRLVRRDAHRFWSGQRCRLFLARII